MIVVDIGQNFCGDMSLARDLIRLAKDNNADLCKFQLYEHAKLYANHPDIPNVELSFDQAKELFDYGGEIGIEVFFSVFDVERVKWCEKIEVKRYKIAASQFYNSALYKAIKNTKKPIIASLISGVFPLIVDRKITWLYCPQGYPQTRHEFVEATFGERIRGFSDHTIGLDAAKIALARGAQIIEKHFSLDHNTGVDAKWSMTPSELRELKDWENTVRKVL